MISPNKPKIRIFISSPGDVELERNIARRVIRKLQYEFNEYVILEALLWEDLPLNATQPFQEGIDAVISNAGIDIAVFILWTRLGSPPGINYLKEDGSHYKSGTEYEFDLMLKAHKQSLGKPSILAYIKTAPKEEFIKNINDIAIIQEWVKQTEAASEFIRNNFYDNITETVYKAYHNFNASTVFENKLTTHLKQKIHDLIPSEAINSITWNSCPYRGLESFDYDHEAIFCGRQNAINELEEKLEKQATSRLPFLLIIGSSGSGKSSLVKAGLVPDIVESGFFGVNNWRKLFIKPSNLSEGLIQGLFQELENVLPELTQSEARKQKLVEKVLANPEILEIPLEDTFEKIQVNTGKTTRLLLYIDQFEEIFSDPSITKSDRELFIKLISVMAKTKLVWIIATIRSDFYHRCLEIPELINLKNGDGLYDLLKMSVAELEEIITEPAKRAGLKWEMHKKTGLSLNKYILNEIEDASENLPLIEFALKELYANRNSNNELTFEAYEKIGGVRGALAKNANDCYDTLAQEEKKAFSSILSSLITVSSGEHVEYIRKTALFSSFLDKKVELTVIHKFIEARLFISDKNANGEPTFTFVHESLIKHWKIIQSWINENKELINRQEYFNRLAEYWVEKKKNKELLNVQFSTYKEAEALFFQWKENLNSKTSEFILNLIKKKVRSGRWFWSSISLIGLLIIIFCLIDCIIPWDRVCLFGDNRIVQLYNMSILFLLESPFVYISIKTWKGEARFDSVKKDLIFWSLFLLFYLFSVFVEILFPELQGETNIYKWLIWLDIMFISIVIFKILQKILLLKYFKKGIFENNYLERINNYFFDTKNLGKIFINSLIILLGWILGLLSYEILYPDVDNNAKAHEGVAAIMISGIVENSIADSVGINKGSFVIEFQDWKWSKDSLNFSKIKSIIPNSFNIGRHMKLYDKGEIKEYYFPTGGYIGFMYRDTTISDSQANTIFEEIIKQSR